MKPEVGARPLKKTTASRAIVNGSLHARSRITNGNSLLPGVDGRSTWARRFRDLIELYLQDVGGPDAATQAEKALARCAAAITVELEREESRFAVDDGAGREPLERFGKNTNTLRRVLSTLTTGVRRPTEKAMGHKLSDLPVFNAILRGLPKETFDALSEELGIIVRPDLFERPVIIDNRPDPDGDAALLAEVQSWPGDEADEDEAADEDEEVDEADEPPPPRKPAPRKAAAPVVRRKPR